MGQVGAPAQVRAVSGAEIDVTVVVMVDRGSTDLADTLLSLRTQDAHHRCEYLILDLSGTTATSEQLTVFLRSEPSAKHIVAGVGDVADVLKGALAAAQGQFLSFVWEGERISPELLARRLKAMKDWTDIVVGGGPHQTGTDPSPIWSREFSRNKRVVSLFEAPRLLHDYRLGDKLFRREMFIDALAQYSRGDLVDLFATVQKILLRSDRISIIPLREQAESFPRNTPLHEDELPGEAILRLVEAMKALLSRLGRSRRKAVRLYIVRALSPLLYEPSGYFEADDIELAFSRIRVVLEALKPAFVVEVIPSFRYRLGFYAAFADDYDLFVDRRAVDFEVHARDQDLYFVRGDVNSGAAFQLLRIVNPRAFVESFTVDSGQATITGRLELPGVPQHQLTDLKVRISAAGKGLGGFVSVFPREARVAGREVHVSEWELKINPRLVHGRKYLDFRIETKTGGLTIRARLTIGIARSSRVWNLPDGGRCQVFPDVEHRVSLRYLAPAKNRKATARRWRLLAIKEDMKAVRDRRPLAHLRIARVLTLPLRSRQYWLISERGDTAQDNGYALFEWVRKHHPEVRARFVLRKDSDSWTSLPSRQHVVRHSSFRHKLLMLQSRVLISSQDIDSYMLPDGWNRVAFRNEISPRLAQKRVFLQHGVTQNGVGMQLHRGVTALGLLVCSSPQELSYLQRMTGYKEELVGTGMPRLDALFTSRAKPKTRSILLMPTWRRYLVAPSYQQNAVDPGNFVGSEYERFYSELIRDERLHAILEEFDLTIDFVPHYEVAAHFSAESTHERIRVIVDGGVSLAEKLRTTPLLVTDFSSVSFDVAYAGSPVIHALFDAEDFYARHYQPGWYDPRNAGVGPCADNVEGVIRLIGQAATRGFTVEEKFAERTAAYFMYEDSANTERTFEAISGL